MASKIVRQPLWAALSAVSEARIPDWDLVSRLWLDALLDSGGTPAENIVNRLGACVRRRDRGAVIREINSTLEFLDSLDQDDTIGALA